MEVFNVPVTEREAEIILTSLPDARKRTYLRIAEEHGTRAVPLGVMAARLYVWNGYLSAVVERTTGEIEVLLRNFIDQRFGEWNCRASKEGKREWLLAPEGILANLVSPKSSGKKPLREYANLETVNGVPTHDDYVAGLTFGNWVHLLPKGHAGPKNIRVQLWEEALAPSLYRPNRISFQKHAMRAKDMRNRASHRRPLVKELKEVELTHQSCVEIAAKINPEMGRWIREEKWIPRALGECPLK